MPTSSEPDHCSPTVALIAEGIRGRWPTHRHHRGRCVDAPGVGRCRRRVPDRVPRQDHERMGPSHEAPVGRGDDTAREGACVEGAPERRVRVGLLEAEGRGREARTGRGLGDRRRGGATASTVHPNVAAADRLPAIDRSTSKECAPPPERHRRGGRTGSSRGPVQRTLEDRLGVRIGEREGDARRARIGRERREHRIGGRRGIHRSRSSEPCPETSSPHDGATGTRAGRRRGPSRRRAIRRR